MEGRGRDREGLIGLSSQPGMKYRNTAIKNQVYINNCVDWEKNICIAHS